MILQEEILPDMLAPAMDGSRILVVDDDGDIRALLSDFLEQHGFAVTAVADGAAMDRAMAADAFDIAVLDVMMPGEDGLSILRRLAARGGLPVIMLSAIGSDIDRIVGLEMGAEDYLPKPCNPRELLARIRTLLVMLLLVGGGKARPFGGERLGVGAPVLAQLHGRVLEFLLAGQRLCFPGQLGQGLVAQARVFLIERFEAQRDVVG